MILCESVDTTFAQLSINPRTDERVSALRRICLASPCSFACTNPEGARAGIAQRTVLTLWQEFGFGREQLTCLARPLGPLATRPSLVPTVPALSVGCPPTEARQTRSWSGLRTLQDEGRLGLPCDLKDYQRNVAGGGLMRRRMCEVRPSTSMRKRRQRKWADVSFRSIWELITNWPKETK